MLGLVGRLLVRLLEESCIIIVLDVFIGKRVALVWVVIQVDVKLCWPVWEFAVHKICQVGEDWCTEEADT